MSFRFNSLMLAVAAVTVATLTPLGAQAQVAFDGIPGFDSVPSQKTRAEVQAELAAFNRHAVQADGWKLQGDTYLFVGNPDAPSKTRAEVRAELAAYDRNAVQADGWKMVGDGLVFVGIAGAPGKSRAEVMAELAAWRKNPVTHDGYRLVGGNQMSYVGN